MGAEQEKMKNNKLEGKRHKGKFINEEVCAEYRRRALEINHKDGSDVGERRELRLELQEEYGLLEIEALNILLGFNVQDYLEKYRAMEHGY